MKIKPFRATPPATVSSVNPTASTIPVKPAPVSEEEKNAAKEAQKFVSDLVLNKYVTLQNVQNEKYGRILADVYINDIHVNSLLLQERFAVPYDGNTKTKPQSWIKYKTMGELL